MNQNICNTIVKKEILNLRNCQYLLVRIANCNLKVGDICKDDLGNVFTVISQSELKNGRKMITIKYS